MNSQLNKIFAQNNKDMEQAIQGQLLRKNKVNVKVKSLSKTTVITIVALLGAAIFSVSFALLFV
jgi:hypothetical protein